MPVNPLKLLKAAQSASTADKERRALMGLYRGYAGDAATEGKTLEELFATPQRKVAEQLAAKQSSQTGLSPRVEMVMVDPSAGRPYELTTRAGTKTQARKLRPEDIVSRSELEFRPDLPTMYHGGTYRRGDKVHSPLYLTDDPEFAQSYVDFKDKVGSRVLALKPEIYRTAPEKRFNELAKRYVPENDEYGYTPASALDPTMHDPNRVADLINALWDDEWDSAKAFDLGMGGNGAKEGVVTIMLPGTRAYAKGGAVKADNKSEIDRLLAKYPGPRDVRYAPQLEGRGSELKNQFPGTYGFLGGLMGTVPDEFERGSVLSDEERARDTAVTKGAEYGYPLGVLANAAPLLSGIGGLAAKYGPGIAKTVAKNAAAPTTLSKQAGVIKAPGGNWLSGSVEDALKGLKRGDYETEAVRALRRVRPNLSIEEARDFIQAAPVDPGDMALNNWIDKQLTRYVKNDMATERDPVRALAERGVLHYDGDPFGPAAGQTVEKLRSEAGFPVEGSGKANLAKTWENVSDAMMRSEKAGDILNPRLENTIARNPWLEKVPPETRINKVKDSALTSNLGFNHLIDELRNATNPQSGLPADLLLKYDALDKVSVPQAVERVAKINEWRAAQKAEADLARANNAATVLHKEYPEAGMKWVELRKSDKVPEGWTTGKDRFNREQWLTPEGKLTEDNMDPRMAALRDALKYEGDTMGHCVGGYCDEVASGASRIYSLRDAKGRPHVTIEVRPQKLTENALATDEDIQPLMMEELRALNPALAQSYLSAPTDAHAVQLLRQGAPELHNKYFMPQEQSSIVQIKGKGNKKPNDEYLPFVQDFVKSGKWSDVGDLQNTGLRRTRDAWNENELKKIIGAGHEVPEFLSADEITSLGEKVWPGQWGPTKYAKGGAVKAPHPCGCDKGYADGGLVQYDPDRINSLVDQLRAEFA